MALTARDKRTLRLGGAIVLAYLVLFYGVRGWRSLESDRADYQRLVQQAESVALDIQRYENKLLMIEKLKKAAQLEPAKWSRPLLVAQAIHTSV